VESPWDEGNSQAQRALENPRTNDLTEGRVESCKKKRIDTTDGGYRHSPFAISKAQSEFQ